MSSFKKGSLGLCKAVLSQLGDSGLCFDSCNWIFENLTSGKMRNLEEKNWMAMVLITFFASKPQTLELHVSIGSCFLTELILIKHLQPILITCILFLN